MGMVQEYLYEPADVTTYVDELLDVRLLGSTDCLDTVKNATRIRSTLFHIINV